MDLFGPVDLSGLDLSGVTGPELLALLVEAALASHGEQPTEAAFWSPDQPRVPAGQAGGGRWASGQSSHVRDYHANAVREIVSGKQAVAGDHAARLAHHLNHLTVEQLHGLKREHGLKGSGKNKAELVQKLAGRFAAARKAPAPAPQAAGSATPPAAAPGDVGRFEEAAKKVGGLGLKHNLLSLADLKQHYPGPMADFHAEIQALRKAGVLTGQGIEGRGGITPEQQAASIHEGGSRIGYVSIRDPEHHRRLAAGGTPTPPAATPPPQAATHRALAEATSGGGFTGPQPRRFGGHFVEHQATGYQVHAHPGGDYSVRRAGSPDYVESRHATAAQAVAAAAKGDRHQSTTGLGATVTAAKQQAVANAEARRQAPVPAAAPGRVAAPPAPAPAPAMPSAPRVTTPHAGTVAHVDALEHSLRRGLTEEHRATLRSGTNRQKRTLLARLAREHKAQGEGPLRAALFRVLGHANFSLPEATTMSEHTEPTAVAQFSDPAPAGPGLVARKAPVVFRAGKYEFADDEPYEMTPEEIRAYCAGFEPTQIVDTHVPSVFNPKLGQAKLTKLIPAEDYSHFGAEIVVPEWFDKLFQGEPVGLSATWNRREKKLSNVALVPNPRITDAALFAAFAEQEAKYDMAEAVKTEEVPADYRAAAQMGHDLARHHGALCRPADGKAGFAEADRAHPLQAMHDAAVKAGADCSAYPATAEGGTHPVERAMRVFQAPFAAEPPPPPKAPEPTPRERELQEQVAALARDKEAAERRHAEAVFAGRVGEVAARAVRAVDRLIDSGRATPGERAHLLAEYRQAGLDDLKHAGEEVRFAAEDGSEKSGSRLQALEARWAARPEQVLTRELLPGDERRFAALPESDAPDPKAKAREEADRAHQSTHTGRRILAGRTNGRD